MELTQKYQRIIRKLNADLSSKKNALHKLATKYDFLQEKNNKLEKEKSDLINKVSLLQKSLEATKTLEKPIEVKKTTRKRRTK